MERRKGNSIVVSFHSDSGQSCTPDQIVFSNNTEGRTNAARFVVEMREERGHLCGHQSVKIGYSDKNL